MKTKAIFLRRGAGPFVLLTTFCRTETARRWVNSFTRQLLLLAAALSLQLAGTVQAQLIDVDFNTNSSPPSAGGPAVGPTMSGAAVLGAAGDQWNGIDVSSGTGIPLFYANGSNSPVTMTFRAGLIELPVKWVPI
jgi:hypothetical protein